MGSTYFSLDVCARLSDLDIPDEIQLHVGLVHSFETRSGHFDWLTRQVSAVASIYDN